MSVQEALAKALANLPGSTRATSFDDESIKGQRVEDYKPKTGNTDRIAVIDPQLVVVGKAHYGGEGVGYVLCKSEYKVTDGVEVQTRQAACCKHLDEAKLRIVVPIVRYYTKPDGSLIKPLQIECLVWRINAEKFGQLRAMHKEWGLDKHDVQVQCEDEQYQRLAFTVTRERLISDERVSAEYGPQVTAFITSIAGRLAGEIGRDLPEQKLLEKLGKIGPASTVRVADAPVGDIDDLLGK